MRFTLLLVLFLATISSAEVFDDFEYENLQDGDWYIIAQTGTIAEIEISSEASFSGTRSLYLESMNQEHFWDEPCDRQKFCAIEKALPLETATITFAYRFWVYWQGNGWNYNHGESSGYAKMGFEDSDGCTASGHSCIDACINESYLTTSEWAPDGLVHYYDSSAIGADGEMWYLKEFEVPVDADFNSLLLNIVLETNAWSHSSDFAYTHIKLWIDFITYETAGVGVGYGTWSAVKALY
jgi:hypothetical protein